MSLDPDLLEILACPQCRQSVREDGGAVLCQGCGRTYPVREIPIMLLEEATGGE